MNITFLQDSVSPGYLATFQRSFTPGMADALGRVKGAHYKEHPPAVRFSMRLMEDGCSIKFTCDGCNDHELVQRELLALMKALRLVPDNMKESSLDAPRSGVKSRSIGSQPAAGIN